MDKVKDKVIRLKHKANLFQENKIKAFIKTYSDDYYFCEILAAEELRVKVISFSGKRAGYTDYLLWLDIEELQEYRQKPEMGEEAWDQKIV